MRRSELAHLAVFDLDTERGTILIRQGKGKKDRMVPVGERAAAWIDKYVYESRPQRVALLSLLAAESEDEGLELGDSEHHAGAKEDA